MIKKDGVFYIRLIAFLTSVFMVFTIEMMINLNYLEKTLFIQYFSLFFVIIMIGSMIYLCYSDQIEEKVKEAI